MTPRSSSPPPPPGSSLLVIGTEARLTAGNGRTATRELLRVDAERRFELRADVGPGLVTVDFGPGVFNVTLIGAPRAAVDVEFMVVGIGPVRLDAWCTLGAHSGTDIRLIDGFGRLVVPDLSARTPRSDALSLVAGRYLLSADAFECPAALRIAEPIGIRALRAAV